MKTFTFLCRAYNARNSKRVYGYCMRHKNEQRIINWHLTFSHYPPCSVSEDKQTLCFSQCCFSHNYPHLFQFQPHCTVQAALQGAPIKNNPLGKIHYLSYCNSFCHQIYSFPRGWFAPHTQQISSQYLLWFKTYNYL